MDQFAKLDIKMACSRAWKKQVDEYLENACEFEPKHPYIAAINLRKALAIERLHRMVEKGMHPAWNWDTEEWVTRKE